MDMVNAPFVSPSVSATKRMDPVSVADIAIASPFIKINARYCVALIIVRFLELIFLTNTSRK